MRNNLFESNDPNLKTNFDYLGMLGEGTNDLNRYYFSKKFKHHINNETGDIFNHTISTGGYNNGSATIYPNRVINAVSKGGIVPLPPLPQNQWKGDEVSSHPVPLVNALVDARYRPLRIIDKPLDKQMNPMSIR